jgi:hypothetical protein
MSNHSGTILIYTIHRVEPWWAQVGLHMGYEKCFTVSDLRGEGDFSVVEDFYTAYRRFFQAGTARSSLLDEAQIADIIARCRLLRWLPVRKAAAMVLAMEEAFEKVLDVVRPTVIVAFPMDRYVSDVLERVGAARGIPFFELTASAVPNMSMLLYRGRLITRAAQPDPALVDQIVREIADPLFTPAYVQGPKRFTPTKWLKIFAYFRLRGWFFKGLSWVKRDRLGLHYMDAQSFLGHKPHLGDVRICDMVEYDWRKKINAFPEEQRLFIGLQLFPEASIDYWIDDVSMIQHEELLFDVAKAFTGAGYVVLVKDHPLQFGFRQVALLNRLKTLPNVVLLPYEVSGNEALDACGVNFTCTGTLGMQAALTGKKSITTSCYYTTPEDFIHINTRAEVPGLPARVEATEIPTDLGPRQRRIITNLLKGSFASDFFSFQEFDPANPKPTVADLGAQFGQEVLLLGEGGESWHARNRWPLAPQNLI